MPLRVLTVDDEPRVRSCIAAVLRKAGFEVAEAADGVEALELIEREGGRFAAVITDIRMPRMDGIRFEATLRALHPHIPVLFLTGFAGEHSVAEIPPERILAKPFAPDELLKRLRKITA